MRESIRLKSFELICQDIRAGDIRQLHTLSMSVGWPQRTGDWELLLQAGHGIVAVDEIGRIFGSAMWFPHGDDFATIGLVITSPRLQAQGGGRWLMEQLLSRCGSRRLTLNATRTAYPLYLSLGFEKEGIVHLHQGEVAARGPALTPIEGDIDALDAQSLHEIATVDKIAWSGIDRVRQLALVAERGAIIRVLRRDSRAVGYSMSREFGRGHVVGPIVAGSDDDAMHLATVHLDALRGSFVRVDTRSTGRFAAFLRGNGLPVVETVTTMSKGNRFLRNRAGEPLIYGLVGHALN